MFIAHGRNDPIMDGGFARRARELIEAGGLRVDYHESDAAHHIDPATPGGGARGGRRGGRCAAWQLPGGRLAVSPASRRLPYI